MPTGVPRGTPVNLRDLSIDELLELGVCECGQRLSAHSPTPKPAPLASWQAGRVTPPELRSGSSLGVDRPRTDAEMEHRRRFAGTNPRTKPRPWVD